MMFKGCKYLLRCSSPYYVGFIIALELFANAPKLLPLAPELLLMLRNHCHGRCQCYCLDAVAIANRAVESGR